MSKLSLICAGVVLLSGSAAMAQPGSFGTTDARGGANGPSPQVGGDANVANTANGSTSSSSMLMYRLKQESAAATAHDHQLLGFEWLSKWRRSDAQMPLGAGPETDWRAAVEGHPQFDGLNLFDLT